MPTGEDPAETLSEPPTHEDLDELLADAAPRPRSKVTIALVTALVFLLGFLAGSTVERIAATVREAQPANSGEIDDSPATGGTPTLIGTLRLVDGEVLYVERADGGTVKVLTNDTTLVGMSQAGEIGDLEPGDIIIVQGERQEDGTVAASSVVQSRPDS